MQGRNLKVSDDVRQVFGRMLAVDEQIAQTEEASGMLPDFEATNEAIEKLQARSLRDLKWTVNARNRYIKAVQEYNVLVRQFPSNLTAMVFSYAVKPSFTVQNEAAISAPPAVSFDKPTSPAPAASK
jgi:LemA protein